MKLNVTRNYKKLTICFAAGLVLFSASPSRAIDQHSSSSMISNPSNAVDGSKFLQSLLDRVIAIKDYWYESTLTTFNAKGKAITESGRFYFKTPRMIRFEALKAGKRSGSVVVCQPDGKIRAKAGGMMGGVTLTLSPKSKLLRASNGYNLVESDLLSLLQSLRASVNSGKKCLVTGAPCAYPGIPSAYVLEFIDGEVVSQRIALDTEQKLPVEWVIFDNGKILSLARISKLAINSNIADTLFYIERSSAEGKGLDASSVAVVERLRQSLSATDVLNYGIVADIKVAINELKTMSEILSRDSLTQPGTDGLATVAWLQYGRAVLLSRATKIELLSNSLIEARPAIQNFENNHSECANATDDWLNSLELIDQSVWNLYLMLETDEPDPKAIVAEANNIKTHTHRLESVMQQISECL